MAMRGQSQRLLHLRTTNPLSQSFALTDPTYVIAGRYRHGTDAGNAV
jgi:hypothetical protein